MGKSNTIQEQQKTNQEFQKYIDEMTKNMTQRQDALSGQLDEMEKRHYANFSDKALLVEGKYSHLTTVSEWSLESVNIIIEECSKAIFGNRKTPPKGSDISKTDDKTGASLKAIESRQEYIASKAFDIVQAIIGNFSSITTTKVEQKVDAKPIVPGMTLFIGVENNAYSSEQFFRKEKIIQIIFVFRVCYSIKEGQAQSSMSDLEMYENLKETCRKRMEELYKEIIDLNPDDPNYKETYTKLEDRLKGFDQQIGILTKRISELTKIQMEKERNACKQIVEQIQAKRASVECARNGHQRTSTGFTCTESRYEIEDRIRAYTPGYAHLVSVTPTDYVGNHFKAVFSSAKPLSKADVDQWVASALTGRGNFHFD